MQDKFTGNVVVITMAELLEQPDFAPKCGYNRDGSSTAIDQMKEVGEYAYAKGYALGAISWSNPSVLCFTKR